MSLCILLKRLMKKRLLVLTLLKASGSATTREVSLLFQLSKKQLRHTWSTRHRKCSCIHWKQGLASSSSATGTLTMHWQRSTWSPMVWRDSMEVRECPQCLKTTWQCSFWRTVVVKNFESQEASLWVLLNQWQRLVLSRPKNSWTSSRPSQRQWHLSYVSNSFRNYI